MRGALVIGLGNPLRGDDGLGWHVIEQLRGTGVEGHADLLACHQLTPELAAPVAQSARVIFVDAAQGGLVGEVCLERINPEAGSAARPAALSHHLDPAGLIRYTKQLYAEVPEAMIVSVRGAAYGLSEHLSEPVLGAIPQVLRVLNELLTGEALPAGEMEKSWLPT